MSFLLTLVLNKFISGKKTETLFIIFLSLLIFPFCVLSFYNHPSAEDFFFWTRVEKVGFINALTNLYKNWSGRFFTHAELLLNPLLFRTFEGYKVFTLVMMLIFLFVVILFVSELTGKSSSIREKLLISLSIFFLYLYGMPAVSEGLYWLIGVPVYHNTLILVMLFIICFLRLKKSVKQFHKIFYLVSSCLLVIAIGGSNEIAMSSTLLLLLILFFKEIYKQRKIPWNLSVIIISLLIAAAIDIFAPGTGAREGNFLGKHKFIYSIILSFSILYKNLFAWIFGTPVLPVTILLIPAFANFIKNGENRNLFPVNPLYGILFCIAVLYMNIFLSVWSTGNNLYKRTLNVLYFEFLLIWFFTAISSLNYFNLKRKINFEGLPKFVYAIAVAALLAYLFKPNNVRTAYSDLIRGTAAAYDNEQTSRYEFIQSSNSDTVVVDSLKHYPKTIFAHEITTDPNSPYNSWYARFFNKKIIVLKK